MLFSPLPRTLLELLCEILFNFKDIVKSTEDADEDFQRNSQALMG